MIADKFAVCANCINKELDPFQCETCSNASNHETNSDDVEEITYHELIELIRSEEW